MNPINQLLKFMKIKKISQRKIASDMGIAPQSITIFMKKSSFTKKDLIILKSLYNLNPEWLLEGKEPMILPPPKPQYSDEMKNELNNAYDGVNLPRKRKIHGYAIDIHSEQIKEDIEKNKLSNANLIEAVWLPIIGIIPAGEMNIMEVSNIQEADVYPVPQAWLDKNYEHFLLRVNGDSMNECEIYDGDVVVLKRSHDPQRDNNKICAVRVNDEYTLKTVFLNKKDRSVSLIPCNSNYSIKKIKAKDVVIEGVYVGRINFNKK